MKNNSSRSGGKRGAQPIKVRLGRTVVTIYRRLSPAGNGCFMVANYSTGKRRFDSYATETEARDAAQRLVRQLSERQVVAASMTNEQAAEYAAAVQSLKPHNVTLPAAADVLGKCLEAVGDLPGLLAAVKFYAARHKRTTRKPVAEVVAELLAVKEARRKSPRYLADLRSRLGRVADVFRKNAGDVTTAEVQAWLDSIKLSPQSYKNFRTVAHLLFEFAVARGYAADNPVARTEVLNVGDGDIEIFTPAEIRKLLAAASPDFLPSLALGAFAGLRSAEIERLEWADIDLAGRHVTIGASKAKTASRRVVPVSDNLAAWLSPYAARAGKVWPGTHEGFYEAQQSTADAAGLKWKANGLRHSYATYRCAQTADAGRVAGELGNSAAVVHRHYRQLVKSTDATRWFSVLPNPAENIVAMRAAVA